MLVEQARGGNLQAFDRLVERFQDAIYGPAYALPGLATVRFTRPSFPSF